MSERDHSRQRRLQRPWPVQIHALGAEPRDDHGAALTPGERLSLLAVLSARMWELTRRPLPSYSRGEMPIRILHRR